MVQCRRLGAPILGYWCGPVVARSYARPTVDGKAVEAAGLI